MQVKFNIFFNISYNKPMIDLIDECGKDLKLSGYHVFRDKLYGIEVADLCVENKKQEKMLGFGMGDYVIISSPLTHMLDRQCHDYVSKIISRNLQNMLKKQKIKRGEKVLIIGLGNPDVLGDSLGIKTLEKIKISPFEKKNYVYKFAPNVFLCTGIDSFDIIHMLAIWLGVDYVIIIDSLATTNIKRLSVSIQINSSGLTPGSAMHHKGKKISRESLGVPCFAIGVPLMFLAGSAIDGAGEDLVLTPKDIHENLDTLSYIIAKSINASI